MTKPSCSEHATDAPTDRALWKAWARRKSRAYKQEKCPGCGLYKIWRLKPGVRANCLLGDSLGNAVRDIQRKHESALSSARVALSEARACGCASCLELMWELETLCKLSGKKGDQDISSQELADIRVMGDFDLTMLLSEIHDHGWPVARKLIPLIQEADQARLRRGEPNH